MADYNRLVKQNGSGLLKIALVVVVLWAFWRMSKANTDQEHLDSVFVNGDGTYPTSTALNPSSAVIPAGSVGVVGSTMASNTASAALLAANVPAPLTSSAETLLAAAPAPLPAGTSTANVFSQPQPVDMDSLFERTNLDPQDLIPKTEPGNLFSEFAPDPNQNFLNNRWSLGLETSVSKRSPILDLRGQPAVPISAGFNVLWNAPTIMPDVNRRSLCDIS